MGFFMFHNNNFFICHLSLGSLMTLGVLSRGLIMSGYETLLLGAQCLMVA